MTWPSPDDVSSDEDLLPPVQGLGPPTLSPENPDPTKITDAMWWLAGMLLVLEPGTQIAGVYANKRGYHNTRAANETTWPGDYSIRDSEDRRGPSDKAAAIDWTFPEAFSGDFSRMARYGVRLKAAWDTRDPRVSGWREALGQTDTDGPPEGLDFRHHSTRVPDDTHRWHWHFSEDRDKVFSYPNKAALLSVLSGEPLADWQARGGADMAVDDDIWRLVHDGLRPGSNQTVGGVPIAWLPKQFFELDTAVAKLSADVAVLKDRPSGPPATVDPAALKAVLLDPDVLAAIAKAVADEEHRRSAE